MNKEMKKAVGALIKMLREARNDIHSARIIIDGLQLDLEFRLDETDMTKEEKYTK